MTSFTDWVDEPRMDGTWTNYATLRDPHFFVDLARMNIRLFRDEIPHGSVMRLNLDLEPAPYLDYDLFKVLVSIPGRALGSHNRKALENIIDARKDYFRSHEEYRRAFCRLQDAWAYGVMVEQDRMQLINSGTAANAKQLENNAIALQKNDVDMARLYDIAIQKREMRRRLTTAFSQTKESFLRNELGLLLFLGKHLYKRHLEIVNSQGSLQKERQSNSPAQKSVPSENSNVVPLGFQEIGYANVAVMNQHAQRVNTSNVPSGPQLMEPRPSPMVQEHLEPVHQNAAHYPSLAGQPFGPFQPAQQAPLEQGQNSRANKLLSSSQAPILPTQLAPMHQRSTLSPQQTAILPSDLPSHATKQQMLRFLNYGRPAPTPAAPDLAPTAPVDEAPPPRSVHPASWTLAPMQEDRKYAPRRRAVYATPYAPREPREPTGPRHSEAALPTISYSRVPVQQKVKTAKPVAPAGGFLGRLLETEMTEKELDEIAARLGPEKRGVEEEASEEML